jgi:flagellar hook-associated protein FlgK
MANFDIGLSGLSVAQQALEIVGTNLANAGTAGYHRQEVNIAPVILSSESGAVGGAKVSSVTRTGDPLVDKALLNQQPIAGQLEQELTTLQSVEDSLGTVGSSGLGNSLNGFFDSLQQLASQPDSQPYLQQTATAGEALAESFQGLSQSLTDLNNNVRTEAQQLVGQVNSDAQEIAQLNTQIEAITNRGGNTNLLLDKRDGIISDLSKLANVQVTQSTGAAGSVDVTAWGTALVVHNQSFELEAGESPDGKLGITVQGESNYQTNADAGSIGGLIGLANQTLKDIGGSLDALAGQIIQQVNRAHVQGVGTDGSFTELAGGQVSDGPLSSWGAGISAGQFYVRITDTSTGAVTRSAVTVNPNGTLADIVSGISAIQIGLDHPLTATVADSSLRIHAEAGYEFDFLPAPTPQPDSSTLSGTSQPKLAGSYIGNANQTYTVNVVGNGQVGVTDGLQLAVNNAAGETVATLNVGSGYAAGDALQLDQGLTVAMGSGTLNAGETFHVQGLADSDPTGFLAAAGLNTFFQGSTAGTIALNPSIQADPGRIAASLSASGADNGNISKMAALQTSSLPALGNTTPSDYFDQLLTSVGQKVQVRQTQQAAVNDMIQQLQNQQSGISGVDVNQEAANLLIYQRMFQSVAKYITTVDETLQYLNQMMV